MALNVSVDYLISLLEKYLGTIKVSAEYAETLVNIDECRKVLEYCEKVRTGEISILDIDVSCLSEENKKTVNDYKKIEKSAKIFKGENASGLIKDQKREIRTIFYNQSNILKSQISILEGKLVKLKATNSQDLDFAECIKNTINKLKNGNNLDSSDLYCFKTFFDDIDCPVSIEDQYEINKFLGAYLLEDHMKKVYDFGEPIEDIEENDIFLSDEDLEKIFIKHGVLYSIVPEKYKEKLRKFGNLKNIDIILGMLVKYGISSDYFIESYPYDILIYSTPDIVMNVINVVLNDTQSDPQCFNDSFNQLIANPRIFIKVSTRMKKSSVPFEGDDFGDVCGAYQYFIENRNFLKNHNVDIRKAYDNCFSFFSVKTKTVIDTYNKFISYGLTDNLIFSHLSSFALGVKGTYYKLDSMIELDLYPYVLEHLPGTVLLKESDFAIIKLAELNGIPVLNDRMELRRFVRNHNLFYKTNLFTKTEMENADIDMLVSSRLDKYDYYTGEKAKYKALFDSIVSDYIYDNKTTVTQHPVIIYMDQQFLEDSNKYDINGIIISRKKVLRIFDALRDYSENSLREVLIYSIISNSILTKDEVDTLVKTVDHILVNSFGSLGGGLR